jgi:general secretion pathway protein D
MKKLLTIIAVCLGAAALTLPAQTPPAPGAPAAPKTDEQIRQAQDLQRALEQAQTNRPTRSIPARTLPSVAPVTPAAPPAFPVAPGSPPPGPTTLQASPPNIPAIPSPGVAGQLAPGVNTTTAGAKDEAEALNIVNMEMGTFLDIYSDQVGKTLIYGQAMAPLLKNTVTLKTKSALTRSEMLQAMESVMAQNGVAIVPMGDKFISVVPEALAGNAGARFKMNDVDSIAEAQSFETRIVQLTNALPSELAQVLAPFAKLPNGILPIDSNRVLVLRDYSVNIKRMMELIEKIDVVVPMETEMKLVPIKYALVADMASVLGSLTSGGAVSTGSSSSSTAARRTGTTGGLNRTGTTGAGGTGALGAGGVNTLQTPNGLSNAAGNRSNFQNQLQQIVQRAAAGGNAPLLGDAKIIPDERTNSLLIFATKSEQKMIKEIIDQLDVVQQQVLIEAVIMEVSLSDNFNFGTSAANASSADKGAKRFFGGSKFTDFGSLTNFPNGLPSGFSYYSQLGSWDLAFTAIAGDSAVNVLSRPRVQTSHAVEASIFVGQTVPFITGSTTDINGGARSTFQNQQVGITLQVLPLINPEGLVVLDIVQQVQQLGEDRIIDNNAVPTTTERNANARVAVKDGETVILGGFISSNKRKSKTGVPFLKDIPVLGALFSQKIDDNQRVELVVLIRPTVLKTPEIASAVAERERQKLFGVRQAEVQILEEEKKLGEKSRKKIEQMQKSKNAPKEPELIAPTSPVLPLAEPAPVNPVPPAPATEAPVSPPPAAPAPPAPQQ